MHIQINGSVGLRGRNLPDDVLAVQHRLDELGFDFFRNLDGTMSTGLIAAIRLFQSIVAGRHRIGGDGRIDVGGATLRFLRASNAPRWQLMPTGGTGFVNRERADDTDHHDFGTDWIAATLIGAGEDYQARYRSRCPGAAPIPMNDVSLPQGGDTPDHIGHETGLDCDISLPRIGGDHGGIQWGDEPYDRDAMRAMLEAVRRQPLVTAVYFNDPELCAKRLCSRARGHDNHAHISINPPTPLGG